MPNGNQEFDIERLKTDPNMWKRLAMTSEDDDSLENVFKEKDNPFLKDGIGAMETVKRLSAEGKLYLREEGRSRHFQKIEKDGDKHKLGPQQEKKLSNGAMDQGQRFLFWLSSQYFKWLGIDSVTKWLGLGRVSGWFEKRLQRRAELVAADDRYKEEYDSMSDDRKQELKALRKHEKNLKKLEKAKLEAEKTQQELDKIRGVDSTKEKGEIDSPLSNVPDLENNQNNMQPTHLGDKEPQDKQPDAPKLDEDPAQKKEDQQQITDKKEEKKEQAENTNQVNNEGVLFNQETLNQLPELLRDALLKIQQFIEQQNAIEQEIRLRNQQQLNQEQAQQLNQEQEQQQVNHEQVQAVPPEEQVQAAPPEEQVQAVPPEAQVQPPAQGDHVQEPDQGDQVQEPPEEEQVQEQPQEEQVQEQPQEEQVQEPPEEEQVQEPPQGEQVQEAPPEEQVELPPNENQPVEVPVVDGENNHPQAIEGENIAEQENNAENDAPALQDNQMQQNINDQAQRMGGDPPQQEMPAPLGNPPEVDANRVNIQDRPEDQQLPTLQERLAAEKQVMNAVKHWQDMLSNSLTSHPEGQATREYLQSIQGERANYNTTLTGYALGILANNTIDPQTKGQVMDALLTGQPLGSQHNELIQQGIRDYNHAAEQLQAGNSGPMADMIAGAVQNLSHQASQETSLSPRHAMLARIISNAYKIAQSSNLDIPLSVEETQFAEGAAEMGLVAMNYYAARQYLGQRQVDLNNPKDRAAATDILAGKAVENLLQQDREGADRISVAQIFMGVGTWSVDNIRTMISSAITRKGITQEKVQDLLERPDGFEAACTTKEITEDMIATTMREQVGNEPEMQMQRDMAAQQQENMPHINPMGVPG